MIENRVEDMMKRTLLLLLEPESGKATSSQEDRGFLEDPFTEAAYKTQCGSGFGCRLLTLNGEWSFTMVTGCLFLVTFCSLVSLNFSDPGILYQGKASEPWEKLPEAAYVAWMYQRAFQMLWCPHCSFHCLPRTFHCGCCNICEEEFDHHCRWVNNCVGNRNIRLFLLLLMSPFLYLGALVVMCTIFLVSTSEMPFSLDKAMAYPYMAVPATGALLPLTLGLLIQAVAMSTATRSYEGQVQRSVFPRAWGGSEELGPMPPGREEHCSLETQAQEPTLNW
uniref:LOW QUALITY PROTEIN: palmitoyltransferase ZDHHC19-like n=1 Tax=Ictidomys tridecemlineatus TaxID=43179 RepID=UPI000681AE3D|nr:LOW QUALITY PROTEIN: palmitoyltransferase ZDHHC19-like [Ictidomys tridecemlineatus]